MSTRALTFPFLSCVVCVMFILSIALASIPVIAKRPGGPVAVKYHVGALLSGVTCDGIKGYVKVVDSVVYPGGFHVAPQIHGYFSDRLSQKDSWVQIGYVKGEYLTAMKWRLYVECMYYPGRYSFSPYYNPDALMEQVTIGSWNYLEIKCTPTYPKYNQIAFYFNGILKKTCTPDIAYPRLAEISAHTELTCSSGQMFGEWNYMKYIIRRDSAYYNYDWATTTPFKSPTTIPGWHCVLISKTHFYNT